MEYSFKYKTEHFGEVEVFCDIFPDSEDEAFVEQIEVYHEHTKTFIPVGVLTKKEQVQIEIMAQDIANEKAYDLYYEKKMFEAEAYSDYLRDR